MATVADLIAETRRLIMGGAREELNRLNGAVTSSATTWTVDFGPAGIQAGARIACELEVAHVWSVASLTATVQRGVEGSTGAAHADEALVRVNPVITDFDIWTALNHELDALSAPRAGLFQVVKATFDYSAATDGYDLTGATGLVDVLEVRYDEAGSQKSWPQLTGWRVQRNHETSDFASGLALILGEGGYPGRDVEVVYAAPFTALSSTLTTNLTATGLPTTAYDIPALGAAARLVGYREAKRNFIEVQGEPRIAEEVGAGAIAGSSRLFLADRERRVNEEVARLKAAYPRYR